MPSNVLLTPTLLTKLTLMNLGDRLFVARNMSKAYTDQFGKKGAKAGDTFYVRKPQRFTTTSGLAYSQQGLTDTQTPLTVNQVTGVHFQFDSQERTLSLDFINERYAKPAAIALANAINSQAAAYIAKNTFNAVGTPGTTPTSMATYLAAEDLMVAQGVPQNESLTAIINRKMSSAFINASSTLFNNQNIIGKQQETGRVVNQLGYNWEIDQTIYSHTVGALGGSPEVSAAPTETADGNNGTGTLVVKGLTASITGIWKAGDVLTIAGVNSVHPQTRVDTSYPQQFVVTADVTSDGSGNATVTVSPAFTSPTASNTQQQNISALPAVNAAITVWAGNSSAGLVSPQGLLLHQDAFAFMSVPFENPEPNGVEMVAQETDPDTGMSLSFIRYFDGDARVHKNRFDTLYGFAPLYRELACRIAA